MNVWNSANKKGVVMHSFNPRTPRGWVWLRQEITGSLKPAWATEGVQGLPELHSDIVSKKTKKEIP